MRTRRTLINTIGLLIYQIVTAICGFILPRLILSFFGSSYNGIISSITQFIGCVVLLRSGLGAVTRVALYKPLSEGNEYSISRIIRATEIFMRKVALFFVVFLVLFSCVYPLAVKEDFSWRFTFTLVLILGFSTFIENFFGIPYLIVLEADQKKYVQVIINTIAIIINTAISAFLIYMGFSIHVVKLGSALVFAINPLFLFFYVRKKYKINTQVEPDTRAISQRWDAFAIQAAYFINNNTDIMVLTIFSNVREVSVYAVYHIVVQMLYNVENALCGSVGPAFGNMIVHNECENLKRNVRLFEYISFASATFFYTCGAKLIVPFVQIYTSGIIDVSYDRPLFGYLMCLNYYFLSTRMTYVLLVEAAGHFKQMKVGATLEAVFNICISVVLVIKWGLIGVAIGTLCAVVFRTLQYALYSYNYILKIPLFNIIKNFGVSLLEVLIICGITCSLRISNVSFGEWCLDALSLSAIVSSIVVIFSGIFYKTEIIMIMNKLKKLACLRKG